MTQLVFRNPETNLRIKEILFRLKETDLPLKGLDFRLLDALFEKRGLNQRIIDSPCAKIGRMRRKNGLDVNLLHLQFGEKDSLLPMKRANH